MEWRARLCQPQHAVAGGLASDLVADTRYSRGCRFLRDRGIWKCDTRGIVLSPFPFFFSGSNHAFASARYVKYQARHHSLRPIKINISQCRRDWLPSINSLVVNSRIAFKNVIETMIYDLFYLLCPILLQLKPWFEIRFVISTKIYNRHCFCYVLLLFYN